MKSLEIYEVKNPFFLSDTFVFCKKHYEDVFLVGKCDLILFIKVNGRNKIEEIGNDFASRFHFDDYNKLIESKNVEKASLKHRKLFLSIDDEYWLKDVFAKTEKYKKGEQK